MLLAPPGTITVDGAGVSAALRNVAPTIGLGIVIQGS